MVGWLSPKCSMYLGPVGSGFKCPTGGTGGTNGLHWSLCGANGTRGPDKAMLPPLKGWKIPFQGPWGPRKCARLWRYVEAMEVVGLFVCGVRGWRVLETCSDTQVQIRNQTFGWKVSSFWLKKTDRPSSQPSKAVTLCHIRKVEWLLF